MHARKCILPAEARGPSGAEVACDCGFLWWMLGTEHWSAGRAYMVFTTEPPCLVKWMEPEDMTLSFKKRPDVERQITSILSHMQKADFLCL